MISLLLQKYGYKRIDVDYWLRAFDEEHGPQYDDLARGGLTDADQSAYRRAAAEYQEFGPWPE